MSKERLSEAHWILERQLAWIAAAEVKVGVVVAIQVAMLGGLGAAYFAATGVQRTAWAFGSSLACLIAAGTALACAAAAVAPRLKGPEKSMVFFGRISSMKEADYVAALVKATDDELLTDVAAQIHRNALVASKKHGWVGKATMLSFMSGIPWLAAMAMLIPR